ncbi:MAG: HD domain-containing protein [Desulfobacterales bacterium]|jgi:uncharacterized protein
MDPIDLIRRQVKAHFAGVKGSHDWEHTLRVERLCRRIGPREGADPLVLRLAACLHDIGRGQQDQSRGAVCHAHQGARMAAAIMADHDVAPEIQTNVLHCIRTHRYRNDDPPETIEAKVLFDADKLDAIGAVGVARAYLFAGELGAILHNANSQIVDTRPYTREDTGYREFQLKLRYIKDRMLTREGRRLAEARHQVMVDFFERFVAEINGHC